jgi:hypothetical protein
MPLLGVSLRRPPATFSLGEQQETADAGVQNFGIPGPIIFSFWPGATSGTRL